MSHTNARWEYEVRRITWNDSFVHFGNRQYAPWLRACKDGLETYFDVPENPKSVWLVFSSKRGSKTNSYKVTSHQDPFIYLNITTEDNCLELTWSFSEEVGRWIKQVKRPLYISLEYTE